MVALIGRTAFCSDKWGTVRRECALYQMFLMLPNVLNLISNVLYVISNVLYVISNVNVNECS